MVAKDVGQVLGMVFMPSTSRDLLAGFLHEGIIHQKKEDRVGFDAEGMKETLPGDFPNFLPCPGVISQKAGETGEGSFMKRAPKDSNQGGSMGFLPELDKADHKCGEELVRGA